jgi:hypothetical protein
MRFLAEHGVEIERIRLSQSAANEPMTNRLENAWQNENNCVEVFVLTDVVNKVAGAAQGNNKVPSATPAKASPAKHKPASH